MNSGKLQLIIAPMTSDTAELVARLERECFSSPWSLESLMSELSNPLCVFHVALTADRQLAGYAGMHHIIDEGYINNIAVASEYRRNGVASSLLESFLAYARANGLRLLTLEVRESNAPAIALYKSFDFETCGLRRDYYVNPTENAVIMTKSL